MNRNLNNFKKVTCILGITFLLMGMIPVPVVAQAAQVVASNPETFGLPSLKIGSEKSDEGGTCTNNGDCENPTKCFNGVCRAPVDCVGSWGDCVGTCGTGTQTFKVTTPAAYDGKECKKSHDDTQNCDLDPCSGDDNDKITICHLPAGEPENAQTISISPSAWTMGSCNPHGPGCHGGDYYGACVSGDDDEEPFCGDGATQQGLGELCDDGDQINDDECTNDCTLPICGDNIQQANEACDDGNETNYDGCTNDCKLPICGNNIQQSGEECDDGNKVNDDGCNKDCQDEYCGDTVLQLDEECDDGDTVDGNGCSAECVLEYCGDGEIQSGLSEVCDDGNDVNGDGCNDQCKQEICGNEILDAGEECDDGDTDNDDECTNDCKLPICGDKFQQTGEDCDDGNTDNDDGCSNECLLPRCGDGIWQESDGEKCDGDELPENAPDGAVCKENCVLEYCGDGITNGKEDCDGEAWCTETCEIKELLSLVLDPYCATKAGVGAVLKWSFMNPNGFTVPVSWTLDGASHGPVMVGAGVNYFAGDTLDAPPSHTLTAWINLPGGPSETFTSNKQCEVPPPPPPGGGGVPIPVTGAGGPTEQLIIPVTGLNLMLNLTGLQQLFTYMGLFMFGITMLLEGVERKLYKID